MTADKLKALIGELLATRISEISEERYSAGWMTSIEFDLWKSVNAGSGWYGGRELPAETLKELHEIAWFCGA